MEKTSFKNISVGGMEEMTEEEQVELVKKNALFIQDIENPSEKVQLAAIKKNIYVFKSIKNPTFRVQLEAVKRVGTMIQYIKEPEKEIKKEAVQADGISIQYIIEPNEELKTLAVQQNGLAINYIKNPSENIQLAAVKQNPDAIMRINRATKRTQLHVFFSYAEQKKAEIYSMMKQDPLFDSLARREKERFLLCLLDFKEALEEKEYFEGLLHYLILYRKTWVQEYIDTNAPLTIEQESIWKKHRLKTLV